MICLYLENVKNGRKLLETARRVKSRSLSTKVAAPEKGAKAAMSHTAGMANNDVIFESACRQSGIVRLKSITELYTLPKIFTEMPLMKGKRVAVFTNSGAFGGITADLIVESGLEMAVFPEETKERLRSTAKLFNVSNPVDLGPTLGKQTFIDIWDAILSSDTVDGLLAVPNVWMKVVVEAICELGEICKIRQAGRHLHPQRHQAHPGHTGPSSTCPCSSPRGGHQGADGLLRALPGARQKAGEPLPV